MICYAGITLLTDEQGAPLQVNIDLRRHGAELATFLRAHGLLAETATKSGAGSGNGVGKVTAGADEETVAGSSPATGSGNGVQSHADRDNGSPSPHTACALTLTDELAGALTGSSLSSCYEAADAPAQVVYRPGVRRMLQTAVAKVLQQRRRDCPDAEHYAGALLSALERRLYMVRRHNKPAPDAYERYGRDMFCIRFRIRKSLDTVWCACYTLHHGTVLVRYLAVERNGNK